MRIEPVAHFAYDEHRDAPNLYPTVAACVDGLGPPFVRKPSRKPGARNRNGAAAPGYLLVPDDTAEYVDLQSTVIGPPYRDVAKRLGLPPETKLRQHGALVLTITDLSGDTE